MIKPASRDLKVGIKITYNDATVYTIIARKSDDSGWWLEHSAGTALHSGGISDVVFDQNATWQVYDSSEFSSWTEFVQALAARAQREQPPAGMIRITDHLPQVFLKPGAQIVIDSTDGPILVQVRQ